MLFFIGTSQIQVQSMSNLYLRRIARYSGAEGTGRRAAITTIGHCWHALPGNLVSHFCIKLCLFEIILQAKCNGFPLCILSREGNVHSEVNNCNTTLEADSHRESSAKLVKPHSLLLECCLGTREALCLFPEVV